MDFINSAESSFPIRIALLDLYEGVPNEGMRCLQALMQQWSEQNSVPVIVEVFEVRIQLQLPSLEFDVFISSGGPGSPLSSEKEPWEQQAFLFQIASKRLLTELKLFKQMRQ